MGKKQTKNPLDSSAHHEDRSKRRQAGARLAIFAIFLFIIIEAWGYYATKTIKPDFLAYQYFRYLIEIPMAFFFFKGHNWALWLFRAAFALAAPTAIGLCVLLIQKDAYTQIVPTAVIPVITAILGTWIVFASENFRLHFKHERHLRSIYD